jgi:hypothetical protein
MKFVTAFSLHVPIPEVLEEVMFGAVLYSPSKETSIPPAQYSSPPIMPAGVL